MLRNNPQDRRSHLYCGGSLKSHNIVSVLDLSNKDSSNRITVTHIHSLFLQIFGLKTEI